MFYHNAYRTDVISVDSAAKAMSQMKNDMVFYKRAYEDSSQNALWKYMVDYFVKRYSRYHDVQFHAGVAAQNLLLMNVLTMQI